MIKVFDGSNKTVSMFFSDVLDVKIVNDESKGDWLGARSEETGCLFCWVIAVLGQV
jgi:hypothetical protein